MSNQKLRTIKREWRLRKNSNQGSSKRRTKQSRRRWTGTKLRQNRTLSMSRMRINSKSKPISRTINPSTTPSTVSKITSSITLNPWVNKAMEFKLIRLKPINKLLA